MTTSRPPAGALRRLVTLLLSFWLLSPALPAAESVKRAFDIPADVAEKSLKTFAAQAGVEVLFGTATTSKIQTNAVKGTYATRDAITRLLAGTSLVVSEDEKTGALTVSREADTPRRAPPSSPAAPAENAPPRKSSGRESGTGVIRGRVSNAATGDFLSGAIISVDGAALQVTTDRSGEFNLSVPAGPHVVTADFSGLSQAQRPVEVAAGAVSQQDFALTSDVYRIEKFVVAGLREGQAAAIQNQRQAMNSKSVAALDAYGNPGAAVGELLQRMPGISVDIGGNGEPGTIYIRGMNQSFSSMMLDGNPLAVTDGQTVAGSYVYLGQVSSSTLESLEIIKAPLPDTDGNAISGYINLRTKRAFDRAPGRRLTAAVGTKWSDLRQDGSVPGKDRPKLDLLSLDYSEVFSVFGGANNLGVTGSVNFTSNGNYVHEAGPSLQLAANNALFVAPPLAGGPLVPLVRGWSSGNWNNNSANNYAKSFGLNVDYKVSANTTVYLKTTANNTATSKGAYPSYFRWRLDVPQAAASFVAGSTYDVVTTNPVGTASVESVLYIRETEAYTFSGGIEQKFLQQTAKLSIDASYNRNRSTYPAINEVKAQITGVGFRLDRRGQDPWLPQITRTAGPDWSDPASYTIVPSQAAGSRVIAFNTPAVRSSLQADLQKDFATTWPSYLKVGVKRATNSVDSLRSLKYYTYSGTPTTPANGGIKPFVGYNILMGQGHYGPFPFLQTPTTGLPNDLWNNPANFTQTPQQVYQSVLDSKGTTSEIKEEVSAAYLQGQVKVQRLRVLGGVRVERTEPSGASFTRRSIATGPGANAFNAALSLDENIARAQANWPTYVRQRAKYNNVFPGLHAVYEITPGLQARASYNVSITRPSGAQLLPNYNVNDAARTISRGNVDLKPYTSDNYEAALQYYFEPIGMVSAGVFQKQLTNYFRTLASTIPGGADNGFDGQYEGYTLNMSRNVGGARIRGIELSYSQQYTFLPGWLRGLGAYANFTYLQTRGDFGGLTTVTQLANLTPRTYNAGLTYRGRGFEVRLLGNYRGKTYIQTLTAGSATASGTGTGGIVGPQVFDLYNAERFLLDLKLQYTINRRWSLYFDIYNLTNEWSFERTYEAFGRENNFSAQGNGTVYHAGVKYRF
jgi:iron complex outermembrane receptor protein